MKTYSILIVDDEPEFITTITDILEKLTEAKFEFFHAVSGKTGLSVALEMKPDIILTDWQMPSMSGIELVEALKEHEETKNIPIVMITGIMTSPEALEHAFGLGVVDFVRKPIEKTEMIARIKSILLLFENQKLIIEKKNIELATYATYLAKNNEFLSRLRKKVIKFKSFDFTKSKKVIDWLDEIIDNIDFHSQKDSWQRFMVYFEKIYPKFQKKLLDKHPTLSSTEVKLAVLVRLNMSSKEIAEITFQQENSIKTARYRLRQKLNLKDKENLSSFLSKI